MTGTNAVLRVVFHINDADLPM